ncbi:MAG: hypothetical protein NT118_02175 [Lentisphaerae bacterium]|nr:hypothetical protein [Lentisphaerota bacterium]
MRKFTEGLNSGSHAKNCVLTAKNRLIHLSDQFKGYFWKMSNQFTVETEIYPESFGNGEDELPVRDFRKDFLADMHRKFKDTFLMAGRTKASDFAGEGDEQVVPAIVAADSGKSFPEIATFDKSFGGNIDYRTPEAVSCRESLGINIFEFIIIGMYNFPERRRSFQKGDADGFRLL